LTQTWFPNKKYYKINNRNKLNGNLFKLLWAQKLQKQKDFQMRLTNHDKSRPTIKSNENQRQEHEVCQT
jgi:hypothetical protein